ncbi:MAG: hypothetical protein ACP5OA_04570 [Candidatus Woesearchaeota archaeon]
MRIQEHIYQGFFGLKKTQDAGKYYHERVDKLKGFDADLDRTIESFQQVLSSHNIKLKSYQEFLNKPGSNTLQAVRREIEKLEGMFDEDELANNKEQKYVIKGIDEIKGLIKNEESPEIGQLENESLTDLNELLNLLKSIGPIWQAQIDFIKKNDKEIFGDKNNIKILSDILKEEGDILRMEETLLRKIDLKTGTILRKVSLREKDIQKTKDMDMNYREVKHIR